MGGNYQEFGSARNAHPRPATIAELTGYSLPIEILSAQLLLHALQAIEAQDRALAGSAHPEFDGALHPDMTDGMALARAIL